MIGMRTKELISAWKLGIISWSDSDLFFDAALREGRLTEENIGEYMFMGLNSAGDAPAFKHIDTRKYLS